MQFHSCLAVLKWKKPIPKDFPPQKTKQKFAKIFDRARRGNTRLNSPQLNIALICEWIVFVGAKDNLFLIDSTGCIKKLNLFKFKLVITDRSNLTA